MILPENYLHRNICSNIWSNTCGLVKLSYKMNWHVFCFLCHLFCSHIFLALVIESSFRLSGVPLTCTHFLNFWAPFFPDDSRMHQTCLVFSLAQPENQLFFQECETYLETQVWALEALVAPGGSFLRRGRWAGPSVSTLTWVCVHLQCFCSPSVSRSGHT